MRGFGVSEHRLRVEGRTVEPDDRLADLVRGSEVGRDDTAGGAVVGVGRRGDVRLRGCFVEGAASSRFDRCVCRLSQLAVAELVRVVTRLDQDPPAPQLVHAMHERWHVDVADRTDRRCRAWAGDDGGCAEHLRRNG